MPDDSALTMAAGSVADAALTGLLQPQKTLPAKLFYDQAGCQLFNRITELPEYYLTRTERGLLTDIAFDVAKRVRSPAVLVEYGASDEAKAELLLNTSAFSAYVPIDVAAPQLEQIGARLRQRRPELLVYPVPADFMDVVALPTEVPQLPRFGFFPGSTIGNFDSAEVRYFLQRALLTLGADSWFLVGVDLRKDPAVLLPAYNDSQDVTAAFNLNLLVRINREAPADFDLDAFAHQAVWNSEASRIEMHLVSLRDHYVRVAGQEISFRRGETIHTENSYKYEQERFASMVEEAGWHTCDLWTDPAKLFGMYLLEPKRGP